MTSWIKNRMKERTSWDGAVCIALGLMILLFLAKIAGSVLQSLQVHGQYGNQNELL